MAGKPHSRREKLQPRNSRIRARRSRSGSFDSDHHPRWWRRSFRAGGAEPAANGLSERQINGRRPEGVESRRPADDKVAGDPDKAANWVVNRRLSTDRLIVPKPALPH